MPLEMYKPFLQCYSYIQLFNAALLFRNYESAKYAHERLIFLYCTFIDVLKIEDEIVSILYKIIDLQDWVLPNIRKYEEFQNADSQEHQVKKKYYENAINIALKNERKFQKKYYEELDKLLLIHPVIVDISSHLSNKVGDCPSLLEG